MSRILLLLASLLLVPVASAGLVVSAGRAEGASEECIPELDVMHERSAGEECDPTSGHVGSREVACLYYDTEQEPADMVKPSDDCPFGVW